jgi:Mn-dependent DtxR family transcriptional regulator
MPYERTFQIEQRFENAIRLLRENRLNAKQLALALDVSTSTALRMVVELRRRGYIIRSVRDDNGWYYEFSDARQSEGKGAVQ